MIAEWWGLESIAARAVLGAVGAFLAILLAMPPFLRWLVSRRVTDAPEKGEAPALDRILSVKKNTPTMGGLLLVLTWSAGVVALVPLREVVAWILGGVGTFCGIGLIDDWTKLRNQRGGLSMFRKLSIQMAVGGGIATALTLALIQADPENATRVFVPWLGVWDLGPAYVVYALLVIVFVANAVNITDGMDGMATGAMAIAAFAFGGVCYLAGRVDFSAFLGIPYVRSAAEVTILCAICCGACMGFLWFNAYPAQIFLGDSGSLALGALLGSVALVTKQESLLFLVGGIFLLEGGCSLLQMGWFKLTRRRLFPIAPPHHIFQIRGLHEVKVSTRFLILQGMLSLAALATLKLH